MLELFAKYTWEDVNITGKPAQVYLWESLCKELWIKMIITVCSPWEYQGEKKRKKNLVIVVLSWTRSSRLNVNGKIDYSLDLFHNH